MLFAEINAGECVLYGAMWSMWHAVFRRGMYDGDMEAAGLAYW